MTLGDLINSRAKINSCTWFHSIEKNEITVRNSAGSYRTYPIDPSILNMRWNVKLNEYTLEIKNTRINIVFHRKWYDVFDLRTCVGLHVPATIPCKDIIKAYDDTTIVDISDYNMKLVKNKWTTTSRVKLQVYKEPFTLVPKKLMEVLKVPQKVQ